MFSFCRRGLNLGLIFIFAVCFLGVGYGNAVSFTQRLEEIGLDVEEFSNKKSISRYEMTRLLNAANCEDCIQSPDWMKQSYTKSFWNDFRAIDGKDFNDIDYLGAFWNKKSYYYCVAYIGDNGYMAGYPKTSTKCQGNFCGQDPITVSEAYQTLLNIIQDQIRQKYEIDWSSVKDWMNGLSKVKREIILNQINIESIKNADIKSTYAQTNDEFQAWLKYCMYNLRACNFQAFGKIGQAYWPISELNVLYKEGIISWEDAMKVAESNDSLRGEDALRIFGLVFDGYSSCSFNVDYDCDNVPNGSDNCPYVYNQNQYDLDGDGIGNVCDVDVDGDGKNNSMGIVDDNDSIVVSVWDKNLDQTPLGDGNLGFSFFINVATISNGFPTTVTFEPLTNGDIDIIERDFGDGFVKTVKNGGKINHVYKTSGTFIVKAIAKSKRGGRIVAMTKIFVSDAEVANYRLNISPSFVFKNGLVEFTLSPLYSGNLDKIVWDVNDGNKKTLRVGENYRFTMSDDGLYVINARGYKNGELRAVSMLTVNKNGSPSFSTMTISPKYLREETSVTTNLVGVLRKDVDYISIDWGNEITTSSNLSQKYSYSEGGLKTIQQKVFLKNGSVLYSVATIYVQNPNMLKSYALNVVGDKLVYNQNEKLSLGLSVYPKSLVSSLFTSYQAGKKNFLVNPNLSNVALDFAYVTAGDKTLINSVEVNNCVSLLNQGNVHVNSVDLCELALKNNSLSNYKCDQDKDGIPDICDDDIDGDGKKNLIGIISRENKDCGITVDNINSEIFRKEFGICSLDNCPFDSNKDQGDLNNNGIGDICDSSMLSLLDSIGVVGGGNGTLTIVKDQDQDGIPDGEDMCPTVPGYFIDGCPINNMQKCWAYSSCGNGKVDEGETCVNCSQDVGECCGNGLLEGWETCRNCPEDAGECGLCGDGKIDEGENCINCPQDVGECTAYCGNGEIEEAEDCRNCPEDVKECTAICGDGKIQKGEDCKNCKKDVKMCILETCGDGKVDVEAGEECDNGINNGRDGKCTKMCTKYDGNRPDCGNGKIDKGEDCKTCAVDLGEKCVSGGGNERPNTCGDGKIDEGENCINCPQDVGECTAYCGNGEIEEAEDCRNCPEDVKECTAICGDGKIQKGEDCKNCKKDVKMCILETCGDGKVDVEAGEECDNGINNGRDGKCTKMCTKYDGNRPDCGNGKIDKGEDCKTCAVDLGEKCVSGGGNERPNTCGDGKIDEGENCINCPQDVGECTAYCGNGEIEEAEDCRNCPEDVKECTAICGDGKIQKGEDCKNCKKDVKMCILETCGDGKVDVEAGEECDNGINNGRDGKCTKMCTKYDGNRPDCGNGKIDKGEDCKTCAVDLGEKCVSGGGNERPNTCGDGKIDEGENCINCPQDVGECTAYCGNGEIEEAEDCRNCPEDVKECTAICGDGKIQKGEDCKNCKKDVKMCILETCGDGKVDVEAGEECDNGINNGRDGKCTKMCTKYDGNRPDCGNGKIDKGEDCKTCAVDLGEKCVSGGGNERPNTCGDGKIDEGENCINCPQDVGECTAYCGNGEIEEAEDCRNCPEDVKECTAICGDGKIQKGEDCKNCKKDVKMCILETCGDGKVDVEAGEECDNGINNGRDGKCTKMCTKYDGNRPDCGNGKIDKGEDCKTCAVDLGEKCVSGGGNERPNTCGDGKIDEGENCINCPQDVGECTAYCGNGEIEEAEDCRNCPEDVKECTAICGDGKIQKGEDCKNCKKDVKMCILETCGDGKVDVEAGEECDNGINNGRDGKCTKMCTKYDGNRPDCGNGKIDKGEDCKTCAVDLGEKCVSGGGNERPNTCGDGKIDEGENCINCPQDVGECTAYCGNGEIEEAEDCRNCPEDVKECTAICGDGKIQKGEDCKNCKKDVKMCILETCGDGKVDVEAGEECDNGINNGRDGKCTKMCTKYDGNRPDCGNGKIDKGEDCKTCAVDLGEKCVSGGGNERPNTCGDGKIDEGENCDPKDSARINWGEFGCSNSCQRLNSDTVLCNPDYDGQSIMGVLYNSSNLCLRGTLMNFSFNKLKLGWSWLCVDGDEFVGCSAYLSECGDGLIGRGKVCETCSKDLKDICVGVGTGTDGTNPNCQCDECPQLLKDICVGTGTDGINPNCQCDECPQLLKDICVGTGTDGINPNCQCDECPQLLKDICVGTGTDGTNPNCQCDECPQLLKDICVGTGTDGINPDCKCDKCPEKPECIGGGTGSNNPDCKCDECIIPLVRCVDYGKIDLCGNGIFDRGEDCITCPRDVEGCNNCGNGVVDEGETYENCPDDFGGGIWSNDCNICPCEYVDFSTDLVKGDVIRAKLWDKQNTVFYRYSNSVAIENYLDVD